MKTFKHVLACMLSWLLISSAFANIETDTPIAEEFESISQQLLQKSNKKKAVAVEKVASINDERVLPVLKAMFDGKLYYKKSDNVLILVENPDDNITVKNLYSGHEEVIASKKEIKKVRINNRLRRVLRTEIGMLELTHADESIRLSSAKNLAKNPEPAIYDVLNVALKQESSKRVQTFIALSIALIDLEGDDQDKRLQAVNTLASSVEPQAVGALIALTEKNAQGEYLEANTELAALAEGKLESVTSRISLFKAGENLLFGLSLGSVLLLAAIGLAITFGVMGVINMAHGEMIMLGAYTTFTVQQIFPELIGASLLIAIPIAFLVSGTVGVLMERIIIRHLYGRPLDTLLATFGVSLILQQAVRHIYGSNSVSVISPEWISGLWEVNGALALTFNRIYILFFALLVLGLLALLLKKTLLGLQMRAVTQNRPMANSMGIKASRVDAMTFGLGSGIAGIAGVALSQIASVSPNLGQTYIVDSFMVVVFGGVGNIWGTLVGAMSLGIVNKFLEPEVGAVVGKILVLIFIILFIQWRPRGLFALKGRFVED